MASWLEALNAPDLGIVIAGDHFAATQTMDEEHRQVINFNGAFGHEGPVTRTKRKADDSTVSMSAILLKPGQNAGMDSEEILLQQSDFAVSCKRGNSGTPADWHVYPHCEWSSVRVASTLDQVTLTADFSVPGYSPVNA